MKKKFKKKLLFYVILLLITFCISHFVSADTFSSYDYKIFEMSTSNYYAYPFQAGSFDNIDANKPFNISVIWSNVNLLENMPSTINLEFAVSDNNFSLSVFERTSFCNATIKKSTAKYSGQFSDVYKIILTLSSTKALGDSSFTDRECHLQMIPQNWTRFMFIGATNDTSIDIDNNKETNTKIDKVNESINSEHDDFSNKSCGLICKLKKLPEQLFNKIKSLFVPDNFDFLNDFKETLENKLGFIASVPLQLLDYLISLKDKVFSPVSTIKFPKISIFGYYFWDEYTINTNDGLSWISSFKYLTDIACVILCCNTLRKWYANFTGGEEK